MDDRSGGYYDSRYRGSGGREYAHDHSPPSSYRPAAAAATTPEHHHRPSYAAAHHYSPQHQHQHHHHHAHPQPPAHPHSHRSSSSSRPWLDEDGHPPPLPALSSTLSRSGSASRAPLHPSYPHSRSPPPAAHRHMEASPRQAHQHLSSSYHHHQPSARSHSQMPSDVRSREYGYEYEHEREPSRGGSHHSHAHSAYDDPRYAVDQRAAPGHAISSHRAPSYATVPHDEYRYRDERAAHDHYRDEERSSMHHDRNGSSQSYSNAPTTTAQSIQPSYRRSYLSPDKDRFPPRGEPMAESMRGDEAPSPEAAPSKSSMSIMSLLGTSRDAPSDRAPSASPRISEASRHDPYQSNGRSRRSANGHALDQPSAPTTTAAQSRSRFYSDSPSPPPKEQDISSGRRNEGDRATSSISAMLDHDEDQHPSSRKIGARASRASPPAAVPSDKRFSLSHLASPSPDLRGQAESSAFSVSGKARTQQDTKTQIDDDADEALLSLVDDVKPDIHAAENGASTENGDDASMFEGQNSSDLTPQRRGSQRVKLRNHAMAVAKAAKKKVVADWDSDLSNDENRPFWTTEIELYADQWADRMACIEEAYESGLLQKEMAVGKRLSRTYRTRYEPVLARVHSREEQERRQREQRQKYRREASRKQREREVEMELLGTLDDSDLRNAGMKSKGKSKGQARSAQPIDADDDDSLANELLGSSDDEYSTGRYKKRLGFDSSAIQAAEDLEDLLESRASSPASVVAEDSTLTSGPMTERREQALIKAHRRIWTSIARKDVPKVYRTVQASSANKAAYWRRMSGVVAREARRGASRGNKTVKDQQTRARRVMREMLVFWRKNEKEERELRKKAEKEALEKAKKEEEMREAKRQARKLNFLITQTELYSHFVGNKLGTKEAEESEETSGGSRAIDSAPSADADPTVPPIDANGAAAEVTEAEARLAELKEIDFDDDDEANLRAHARRNAEEAVAAAKAKATAFDQRAAEERKRLQEEQLANGEGKRIEEKDLGKAFDQDDMNFLNPTSMGEMEVKQPKMLTCQLKEYQLKGLNWLANLYEQGINGILADEMGLGKTVQSISLMAYLAEVHDIWGPFLVIAPASTLHNWQQEITRFVPALKALPYWGNVKDRTVLRKFWNRKQMSYHRDAPFHVLITSYQLVVSDEKYFQRVKWQYMVLDEAQAIKSSSSNRWKTLLGFDCRNRLLLTGTPVQNSMQELWALLHFIMPSLFDSHDEFSEWFSKDIESHAENKGTLNEHQLRRLHMILKPFMLRRIKKNVQNELGDKIEIDVYCDMSARQRALYRGLRSRVSVAELMDKVQANDESGLKSLMNLVMQFRKVCNHPELFERADVEAPLAFAQFAQSGSLAREGDFLSCGDSTTSLIQYEVPKLVCRQGGLLGVPGIDSRSGFDTHYLGNLMNIWRANNVHESMKSQGKDKSAFSFVPLLDMTAGDVEKAMHGSASSRIVQTMVHEAERKLRSPYLHDDDFAASSVRAIADISKPIPTNSGESPSLITPLDAVGEEYRARSFLAKPTARLLVKPVVAPPPRLICSDGPMTQAQDGFARDEAVSKLLYGLAPSERESEDALEHVQTRLPALPPNGILGASNDDQLPATEMQVPQMDKLIIDSSKLSKLDELLRQLKAEGHRVLIYFQMTRMIDLMEEYLIYRQYKYLRLDGSSKISDRRDMVTDWQTRPELFIFLLSTRAGGLGINLTAADTVIFYDHDWNPSNDSQAMDRAHRLGQTKQVTVYRLITKNTIDERIVKLARNKKEVQDIVVGNKAYTETGMAKPQEIVNLLLDDDELAETLQRKQNEEQAQLAEKANTMRSNVAKRKAREAAAAAAERPSVAPSWTFDEDEDDFFGAKLTRNGAGDDAEDDRAANSGKKGAKKGKTGRKSAKPADAADGAAAVKKEKGTPKTTKSTPKKKSDGQAGAKGGSGKGAGENGVPASASTSAMNVDEMADEMMEM